MYWLFRALLDLSHADITVDEFLTQVAKEERDDSLEALDKIWEEEAIKFGVDDDADSEACPSSGPSFVPNENQQTTPLHFVDASSPVAATNP